MSKTMEVNQGFEIPVLKKAFQEYEPAHETAAFQNKEDSLPGFIGNSPYEKAALIDNPRTKKKRRRSSLKSKPLVNGDVGIYPPGISVTGTDNLPVPEVDPTAITKPKKRRKKNKVSGRNEEEATKDISKFDSCTVFILFLRPPRWSNN